MSQPEEGWRVALGPTEWVTVSTPGEAVALGRHLATLVAAIGVERAERERLAAELERLKEAWVDKKMEQDRDALAAENERLRKAIMDSVEMRQRLREIESTEGGAK